MPILINVSRKRSYEEKIVFTLHLIFYKQPFFKKPALGWKIAEQLLGLNPLLLSNNVTALRIDEPIYQSQKVQNLHKHNYDEKAIGLFKQRLREIDWEEHKIYFSLWLVFPKSKSKKKNSIQSLDNGRNAKSSKRKQNLYKKYLKRRTTEIETAYKSYKNLFENIKRRYKQNYYFKKSLRFKYNSKTWAMMKELIAKVTLKSWNLRRKITANKADLFDETKIAHEFNSFFKNTEKTWQVKFIMLLPHSNTW